MHVVHLPVVRAQRSLHMTPRARYSVCVGARTLVSKDNGVVNGAVSVTLRVETPVRSPAITDDRNDGFDPGIYNGHQSVGGSVRNETIEHRSHSLRQRGNRGEGSGEVLGLNYAIKKWSKKLYTIL